MSDIKMQVKIVEATVNAPTRSKLGADQLAEYIRAMVLPDDYMVHIYNFFTDCPLRTIAQFQYHYGISDGHLHKYYQMHVKAIHPRNQLEEMISYVE